MNSTDAAGSASATAELLYLRDAYLTRFTARVTAVESSRVALDRTGFYATGGGQPHDTGTLGGAAVIVGCLRVTAGWRGESHGGLA